MPNPLGLSTPEIDLPCDGSYVVIVGSAETPGRYAVDVAWLLSRTTGSRYLQTSRSCSAFRQRGKTGAAIYAVYLGPYAGLGQACAARSHAPPGAILLQLKAQQVATHPRC